MARVVPGMVSTHLRINTQARDRADLLLAHLKYHGVKLSREDLMNMLLTEWVEHFTARYPDIEPPDMG